MSVENDWLTTNIKDRINNKNILININNYTTFKTWDWFKEPSESFKELCKQRATQIRETYDYVIIYHSGGSDSTTVLNSFLNNNIHVDEIVTCYYENVTSPNVDGQKSISDLKQKNFSGIYNRVNLSFNKLLNYYKSDNMLQDGSNLQYAHFIPAIQRYNIKYLEQYGFAKPLKRKEKIAHVVGVGEPKIIIKNNNYYSRIDLKSCFMASSYYENLYFFTSNEFPKLHIKQSYIVARDMQKNNKTISDIKRVKRLIRDEYNPLISPTPIMYGDIKNKLENIEPYSDIHVLLNSYSKENDKFKDLYFNSSLKDSFKRLNNINNFSKQSYIDCLLNI